MPFSRREATISLLERLPTRAASRAVGRLSRWPVPVRLRGWLWRRVARRLGMELSEARGDVAGFASFDALFTRRLRDGARPLEWSPGALVAPCDGRITWNDRPGASVAVKGSTELLSTWLGRATLPWRDPWVVVIYLSPSDYHRVHAPLSGQMVGTTYTPGALVPVNPIVAGDGRLVFGRNERVTCWIESELGPVAVCLVGAMCVGGIEIAVEGRLGNRSARRRFDEREYSAAPIAIRAGQELGTFHMGSTVILVWEAGEFEPSPALVRGRAVKMGQRLGAW